MDRRTFLNATVAGGHPAIAGGGPQRDLGAKPLEHAA